MRFERLSNPERPLMRDGLDPKINNNSSGIGNKTNAFENALKRLVKEQNPKLSDDPSEYDKSLAKEIGNKTKAFENYKESLGQH